MSSCLRVFIVTLVLLFAGAASAQDPSGWLGVETRDVTKAESDQLGWDSPHGAKVVNRPRPDRLPIGPASSRATSFSRSIAP